MPAFEVQGMKVQVERLRLGPVREAMRVEVDVGDEHCLEAGSALRVGAALLVGALVIAGRRLVLRHVTGGAGPDEVADVASYLARVARRLRDDRRPPAAEPDLTWCDGRY